MPDKVDSKELTVRLSFNERSKNFFIDFWDDHGYVVFVKVNENQLTAISKETGIKILHQ